MAKQSVILQKATFAMESLRKCIVIDCHDSANAEARNDEVVESQAI